MRRIRPTLLFLSLFSLWWLAPSVPAWGTDPEILIARGIQRIAAMDYAGALSQLEDALAAAPDNAEACYYAGVAYARLGRFEKAEELLERARSIDPKAASVSFELGLVRAQAGDCRGAADRFDAFRRLSPGDPRLEEIPGLMQACGGWEEKTFFDRIRWRFNGGLGGNYDTNVTLEPENPVGLKDRRPDWSGILFLSAGITPLETERVSLNLDYDFFQSFHVEESGFNVNFNRLVPSLSVRVSDWITPSAGYVFENTLLSWDTYGRVNGGFGKVALAWGKGLFTDVRYAFRAQDYFDTTLFPSNALRTGHCHTVEVRQYAGWKGINFQAYGAGDFDRAQADYWSYDGFRFGLEASFRLWVLQAGLGAVYAERHYQANYPGAGRARLDREQQYSAALTYLITRWLSATLINTTVLNDSNIGALFGYNRNITGLFLAAGLP